MEDASPEISCIIQNEVAKGRRGKLPVRSYKDTQRQREMERVVIKAAPYSQESARKKGFEEAALDEVTGLPGPAKVRQELEAEFDRLAQTDGDPNEAVLGVGRIDFNLVKFINDVFSHKVGDRYIRSISRATQGTMRSSDFVGRDGGDELTLLFCKRRPSNRSLVYALTDVDPNNEGMVVRYFRDLKKLGTEIREEWRDDDGELLSERFRKLFYSESEGDLQRIANGLKSNIYEVKKRRSSLNGETINKLEQMGMEIRNKWSQEEDNIEGQENNFVKKFFGTDKDFNELSESMGVRPEDFKIYRDSLLQNGDVPPHLQLWNEQPFASVTFSVRTFTRQEIKNAAQWLQHDWQPKETGENPEIVRRGVIRNGVIPLVDKFVEQGKTITTRRNSFVGYDSEVKATVSYP